MTPDLRTLAMAIAVLHLLQAIGMLGFGRINRNLQGIIFWSISNVFTAIGLILICLQTPGSSLFITFLFPNILLAVGAALLYLGICKFLGHPPKPGILILTGLIALPAYIWFLYMENHAGNRIIIMAVVITVCYALSAVSLFREKKSELRLSTRFTGIMFALGAVVSFSRAGITWLGPAPASLFDGSLPQVLNLLTILVLSYLWTIGTIFMINQRQNLEISERHAAQRQTERELAIALRDAQEQRVMRQQQLLARDLHDGIGGITANLAMLATLGREEKASDTRAKLLQHIEQMAIEGNREIRTLLNTLEQETLHWGDWLAEIRQYLTKTTSPLQIETDWKISGEIPSDAVGENTASFSLMRAAKEAICNLSRHSRSTRAEFRCFFRPDSIRLEIHDNGKGIRFPPPNGRGLRNMRRRLEELGGAFSIRNSNGTLLTLEAPIPLKYPESLLVTNPPETSKLPT